ncbi:MAG: hypothetical protein AB7H93_23595 [Vicinamibacterales bacterium]
MALDFDADLAAVLAAGAPGATAATFTPSGGAAATVYGFFDRAVATQPAGVPGVQASALGFWCRVAAVGQPADVAGGTLVVASGPHAGSYTVHRHGGEVAGDGAMIRLALKAA